ncbi:uncharacterized protein [Coffea arabica]|uniref:DUF6737 domain-containing protein n=1 Tax=Coffea arabica TaxID=13443 RepID=A0A6P6WJG2_COFAR
MLPFPPSQSLTPCHAALPSFYFRPPPTSTTGAPPPPVPILHFSCFNYSLVTSLLSPKLTTTSISAYKPFKPCAATKSNRSQDPRESSFFDEDGVVRDMDGYLNYLSLEYDSVWDTKPSWCQPWTITTTGVLLIAGSWLFLRSLIVTAGVMGLVCAWWYIFLHSYPKAYLEMIAERRKRVTSGVEDTYGLGRFDREAGEGDAGPSTK